MLADQRLTRALTYAGIGLFVVGALTAIGLGLLWRPGRRR